MAEITAAIVMKLRKMSGQGMMDCKKALKETDGDLEKAMELLRKKGMATLAKREGRETSEGIVVAQKSDDGKTAILASLCCETDFVAKSDDFIDAANKLVDYAMACEAPSGAQSIADTAIDGKAFSEIVTDTVSKTGEKMLVGDYTKYKLETPGYIGQYVHFNKKVGTMIKIETSDENVADSDEIKQVAVDIAMHVTATKPLGLDKDSIPAETIEAERKIYAEQMKDKPQNIIDKIVDGKMGKFFAENCLVAQPFVKNEDQTVEQVLNDAAKKAGGDAKIVDFVFFDVGE